MNSVRDPAPARRLVAILAADVVGYSRLVAEDEDATLARLRALFRDLVQPAVTAQRGRIFKLMGDAFLAEFPAALAAVQTAEDIQARLAEAEAPVAEERRIRLRMGLHLGDVVVEGGDLLGDGVNIAARLESVAEPGGIVLSAAAAEAVRGRVPLADLGERELKNLGRPVRCFRLGAAEAPATPAARPDLPSLAVLPFQNMSGDAEQDYFADGIVEDITTALARLRWLFVTARNTAFTYKGRAVDIRQVGRELGVRYVLEGSVRRAGGRVRITGQLIEAETGAHLWAERFEGALDDVFELQDRITAAVATAVAPSLRSAEIERARRKPPSSLAAYDLLLRALPGFHAMTRDGTDEALGLVRQALSLEPRYAPAAALCALIHGYRVNQGHAADAELEFAECRRLARVAADHGGSDPEVLALAARCLALHGELDEAQRLAAHALAAQPHVAQVAAEAGWVRLYRAEYAAGASLLERALALDALDPMAYTTLGALAQCRLGLGDYPGAIATARRALDRRPHYASAHRVLSSALALSGAMAEAQAVMRRLVEIDPSFSLRHPFLGREPLRSLWASYIGGMRLAGAPE